MLYASSYSREETCNPFISNIENKMLLITDEPHWSTTYIEFRIEFEIENNISTYFHIKIHF